MLVGVQPTGRSFEVQHIHMYRVLDGKTLNVFTASSARGTAITSNPKTPVQ
jgi:hypothetical protein